VLKWSQKHAGTLLTGAGCAQFYYVVGCRDLRMPGVQFPFSTATEDERLAAISNQIGKCPPTCFLLLQFLDACLSVGQPKHAPASAACSRKAVLTSSFAKAE
jgi:hypothetical protein